MNTMSVQQSLIILQIDILNNFFFLKNVQNFFYLNFPVFIGSETAQRP